MLYNPQYTKQLYNPESMQITEDLNNPGKMYIKMTTDDLNEFFSRENVAKMKERCRKFYSMTSIKRGILEANQREKTELNVHIVDLLMACLGKIEYLENSLTTPNENIKKEE